MVPALSTADRLRADHRRKQRPAGNVRSIPTLRLEPLRWSRLDPSKPDGLCAPAKTGDVGYDMVAMETVTIPPMQMMDIPVNAQMHIPAGLWADVRPRSSISRRNLMVAPATIDNGYRGPLNVLMRNLQMPDSEQDMSITLMEGERIAQIVFFPCQLPKMCQMEAIRVDTERGLTRFGSTGQLA